VRLHHVQVACPPGGEAAARRFSADGLGMVEVDKPDELRSRGGAWFRAYDDARAVTAEIHVGVSAHVAPARKAHPAPALGDVAALEAVAGRLADLGFAVDWSQRDSVAGFVRLHTADAHGNRVELLAPQP
jgi:catechol 2,3-dioxygenase-like lactoylglutathione lyase family enzyme